MSRPILDDVVKKANEERHVLSMDANEMFIYQGSVKKGFGKIRIAKLEQQPPAMSLMLPVDRYYKSIKLTDSPAYIDIQGQTVQTVPEVIRIIKAMFLGQASKSMDYSVAMGYVVSQFFTMCLQCNAVLPIPPKKEFTEFQKVVVSEASEYIRCKLEEANIAYETYVEKEDDVLSVSEITDDIVSEDPVVNNGYNYGDTEDDDIEF